MGPYATSVRAGPSSGTVGTRTFGRLACKAGRSGWGQLDWSFQARHAARGMLRLYSGSIKALFRQLDWSFQARHAARGKHAEHPLMYAEHPRMPSTKTV